MNMKPTEEEIKRVWQWCGLWYEQPYWMHKNCEEGNCCFYGEYYQELLKSINLNNLFKYAVPKAKLQLGQRGLRRLLQEWGERIILNDDPALALFWAIYKVIEGE